MIYPLWELGLTNQEQLDPFLFGWWLSPTPLKNHGVRQWGWDDIPYMIYGNMENKIHV